MPVLPNQRHERFAQGTEKGKRQSARQRGYNSRWEKARAVFLAQPGNQLCVMCRQDGLLNPGTMRMDGSLEANRRRIGLVVDHITPHRGDKRLFWDSSNWQPLCHDHHDITKQQEENRGFVGGSDINGRPIDPGHPWNR